MKDFAFKALKRKAKNTLLKKRPGAQDVNAFEQGKLRIYLYEFGVRGAWYCGGKEIQDARCFQYVNDDMLLVTWPGGAESFLRPSDMQQSVSFMDKVLLEEGFYVVTDLNSNVWVLRIADFAMGSCVPSVTRSDMGESLYLLTNQNGEQAFLRLPDMKRSSWFIAKQEFCEGALLLERGRNCESLLCLASMEGYCIPRHASREWLRDGVWILTTDDGEKVLFWTNPINITHLFDSMEEVRDGLCLIKKHDGTVEKKYVRLSDGACSQWFTESEAVNDVLLTLTYSKKVKQFFHLGHMKASTTFYDQSQLSEDLYLLAGHGEDRSFLNTRTMVQSAPLHFLMYSKKGPSKYELTGSFGSVAVLDTERMTVSPWQFTE